MQLLTWLKSKNKSYWRQMVATRTVEITFWIRERGDRSLLVGLGSGVIIVLFFKLIFILLILAAIAGASVYMLAQDD